MCWCDCCGMVTVFQVYISHHPVKSMRQVSMLVTRCGVGRIQAQTGSNNAAVSPAQIQVNVNASQRQSDSFQ